MTTDDPLPSGHAAERSELVDALVRTTFATMAVLNGVAVGSGLSLTQLRVLAILRDRRVRMSELAAFLGLDRSTLSGLVDRAEARGLVERAPNVDDGRAVDVFLTPAGRTAAAALSADVAEALAPLTAPLGAAERTQLQTLLERVNDPGRSSSRRNRR